MVVTPTGSFIQYYGDTKWFSSLKLISLIKSGTQHHPSPKLTFHLLSREPNVFFWPGLHLSLVITDTLIVTLPI